ncbi:helix-turn-helix domain-containing protein [Streptomyces beihaiensis]|uniref:DUF2690 domain-containing protein n=1 Tax=Streptomyces beihaiensis TaxID=2984495 RepID=A0ABT3U4T8_9ACTN|nr:DUF2690 domain-containing protein [Streptomyces beihaiensis]MCX3064080.1 DUF2690 domain-containing protein [Streptomyces beihaiensis]
MSDRDLRLPASSSPCPDPTSGLHAELLSLKQRSGLSYARISTLTHYSKSSWERWINGKQFPPRAAVESFAAAAGSAAGPLLELWDRAERIRGTGDTERDERNTQRPDDTAPPPVAEPVAAPVVAPDSDAEPVVAPDSDAEPVAAPVVAPDSDAKPDAAPVPDAEPVPVPVPVPTSARRPGRRWSSPSLIAAAVVSCAVLTATGLAIAHYSSNHPEKRKPGIANQAMGNRASVSTDPVGCTHAGCTGKDPMAMGCSRDGQTLALILNGKMVIELRYSKACSATWGRITYTSPKAVVDVNNSSGVTEASPVHWGNDVYSPMAELSGHQTSWACGTQPDGKSRTCTVHSPVPAPR